MSELDRVLAFAASDPRDDDADAGDTSMLVSAIDASLDGACQLFKEVDVQQLPPEVQQGIALIWAASSVVDGLMDKLNISDPDDELSEYAKMTGDFTVRQWLQLAGKVKSASPTKPYGDVKYADPKNGKYPVDTEAHVRAAWAYINMPKNATMYPLNGVSLSSVKAAIKAAGSEFGIDFSSS